MHENKAGEAPWLFPPLSPFWLILRGQITDGELLMWADIGW